MKYLWILFLLPMIQPAFAQVPIQVNATTPCFLNYTAGMDLWENCGADDDFLTFMLLPFEWITGGFFSMVLVSIIIIAVYLKYQKVLYAVMIGVFFLPVSYTLFPQIFLIWGLLMGAIGIIVALFYTLKRQTD